MTTPVYELPPYRGTTWKTIATKMRETRHVIDRTLGGDVIYTHRNTRFAPKLRCTITEWNMWARRAKQKTSK